MPGGLISVVRFIVSSAGAKFVENATPGELILGVKLAVLSMGCGNRDNTVIGDTVEKAGVNGVGWEIRGRSGTKRM